VGKISGFSLMCGYGAKKHEKSGFSLTNFFKKVEKLVFSRKIFNFFELVSH